MKEETRSRLIELIGDRTDDAAIEMLELINDEVIDDGVDWKSKYEENDADWRQRYTKRFVDGGKGKESQSHSESENDLENLTIDLVLFEKE